MKINTPDTTNDSTGGTKKSKEMERNNPIEAYKREGGKVGKVGREGGRERGNKRERKGRRKKISRES